MNCSRSRSPRSLPDAAGRGEVLWGRSKVWELCLPRQDSERGWWAADRRAWLVLGVAAHRVVPGPAAPAWASGPAGSRPELCSGRLSADRELGDWHAPCGPRSSCPHHSGVMSVLRAEPLGSGPAWPGLAGPLCLAQHTGPGRGSSLSPLSQDPICIDFSGREPVASSMRSFHQ